MSRLAPLSCTIGVNAFDGEAPFTLNVYSSHPRRLSGWRELCDPPSQHRIHRQRGVLSCGRLLPRIHHSPCLVVNVGVLDSAKSRLQAAVDGASLAAARALNLGETTAAPAASAQQNAVNLCYANFPNGTGHHQYPDEPIDRAGSRVDLKRAHEIGGTLVDAVTVTLRTWGLWGHRIAFPPPATRRAAMSC
jgi:hypothetical protein